MTDTPLSGALEQAQDRGVVTATGVSGQGTSGATAVMARSKFMSTTTRQDGEITGAMNETACGDGAI